MTGALRILVPMVVLTLGSAMTASGQSSFEEILAEEPPEGPPPPDEERFGIHYQAGICLALSTNIDGWDKANYLVTGDLVGLNWSRTRSTFGLGARFTLDENGHRFGLKALWRTPLRRGQDSYLQFSPGIYVSTTTNYRTPAGYSYFFETELGLTRWFALSLLLEVLPYEQRYAGFDYVNFESVYEESGTAVSTYVGAKFGQVPGVIVTVVGVVVGGIIVASSMDGFMGP